MRKVLGEPAVIMEIAGLRDVLFERRPSPNSMEIEGGPPSM